MPGGGRLRVLRMLRAGVAGAVELDLELLDELVGVGGGCISAAHGPRVRSDAECNYGRKGATVERADQRDPPAAWIDEEIRRMSLVRRLPDRCSPRCSSCGGSGRAHAPRATGAKAAPCSTRLAGPLGLPNDPELLVRANGAAMVGGRRPARPGPPPPHRRDRARGLAGAHDVGRPPVLGRDRPRQARQQRTQFLKNLGLLGGLLLAASTPRASRAWPTAPGMAGDAAGRAARPTKREARHLAKVGPARGRLAALQATAMPSADWLSARRSTGPSTRRSPCRAASP